jgi:hypothetical protein
VKKAEGREHGAWGREFRFCITPITPITLMLRDKKLRVLIINNGVFYE